MAATFEPERRLLDSIEAIFGDDEDMIQEIEKYEDLMGPNDHFILRLHYPGMDPETSEEAVRRFGEDVIPHFK